MSASYKKYLFSETAFIAGSWRAASSGRTFDVINPFDDSVVCQVADCDDVDTRLAIDAAAEAFKTWSKTTAKERSALLRRLFELQTHDRQALADLITAEMGKPVVESRGEVTFGASYVEWFSAECRRLTGETIASPWSDRQLMTIRQPLGVVALITPWNFPNAMLMRKLAAVLAAGCTAVVKPSPDSPLSAVAVVKLLEEAGFPPGVVNLVTSSVVNTPKVGKSMCRSPRVAAVSFTGSAPVGKQLLEWSASTVKKVALELGGNAPFVVFRSADLRAAVNGLIVSKFRNAGQTCVCANRVFIQSNVHDEFVRLLIDEMDKQLIVGDGADQQTTIGPLVNRKAVEKVNRHVTDAVERGAKIACGFERLNGNFVAPTVLTGVTTDMLCCNEETFGPVVPIIKFDSEADVIAMANDCRAALAGYFYSRDASQAWRVATALEVGMVGVNVGMMSTCEAPFGGWKESGLGAEGSHEGIEEFTAVKYIAWGVE